jgi:hypothetical protein
MTATPTEQPTDLPTRLATASRETDEAYEHYIAKKELRDELIVQAINDDGLSWRAVEKYTGRRPGALQTILAKAASKTAIAS